MKSFIARHAALVICVMSGFDRLVFRGSLRALRHCGIYGFLDRAKVRLVEFGKFAQETTERVKTPRWPKHRNAGGLLSTSIRQEPAKRISPATCCGSSPWRSRD